MKYLIEISSCDDHNIFEMELNESELATVEKLIRFSKCNSAYPSQPVILSAREIEKEVSWDELCENDMFTALCDDPTELICGYCCALIEKESFVGYCPSCGRN